MTSTIPERRPGGLTAIGVLCIVLAAIGMLAGGALYMMNKEHDGDRFATEFERESRRQREHMTGAEKAMNEQITTGMASAMRNASPQAFRYMFAAGMAGGLLMAVAGIGLLGRRRVLGYHACLASGVAVIACGAIAVTKLGVMYWGFPMMGTVWSIVMILLVHFMYRPILTR